MRKRLPQSPSRRQARRRGEARRRVNPRAVVAAATVGGLLPALLLFGAHGRDSTALAQGTATGANSSPIAISNDNRFVWAVNPDTNTVSAAIVGNDVNLKV